MLLEIARRGFPLIHELGDEHLRVGGDCGGGGPVRVTAVDGGRAGVGKGGLGGREGHPQVPARWGLGGSGGRREGECRRARRGGVAGDGPGHIG